MRRSSAWTAIAAVAGTLVVLVVAGLIYMYSGAYNVAATEGHTGIARWVLETVQERSVAARADDVPQPPEPDTSAVAHGFEHFRAMCVVCHGAPGVERGEIGKGITPEPPELSEEAAEFSRRELFWIVKHGIKLAGMPAFGPTHSDGEIWGIVAFLERLPEMGPEEYARWEARYTAGDTAAGGAGAGGDTGHGHAPGTPSHSH